MAQAWYFNVVRDLGRMESLLNMVLDALTILENRANIVQTRLAKAEARIIGEIVLGNSYSS